MPQKDLERVLSTVDVDDLLRFIRLDENKKNKHKYKCLCCNDIKTSRRYLIDHLSRYRTCCRTHLKKRRAIERAPPAREVAGNDIGHINRDVSVAPSWWYVVPWQKEQWRRQFNGCLCPDLLERSMIDVVACQTSTHRCPIHCGSL